MLAPTHLLLIAMLILLALVLFGPKRLPEYGHGLGKAIREFRKASSVTVDEVTTVKTAGTDDPEGSMPVRSETASTRTDDNVRSADGTRLGS
jgi:sec-independent protein translocase protein TatA